MRNLLLLLGVLCLSLVQAQDNRPVIRAKNGTYALPPALPFEQALQNLPLINGKHYGLVHFNRLPSLEEKRALEAAGWEFPEYIPEGNYLAAIPAGGEAPAGLSVYALPPNMKLSARLYRQDIPEWAWTPDQRIKIVFRFFEGLAPATLLAHPALQGLTPTNWTSVSAQAVVTFGQLEALSQCPYITYLQEAEAPGEPENFRGRTSHRVNVIQNPYTSPIPFDGNGVVVGHGDDGDIDDHIDYTGRIIISKAGPSMGDHGDHVAGTIFGAGNKDERGQGMAPAAQLVYYDYPDNLDDVDTDYGLYGVRITNSSYSNGCNAGYTAYTAQVDQDIIQNPKLIHVFSAGNNGTTDCGYGAGSNWGNITGGHKQGKNVIAVANLTYTDGLAGSSSRGPAEDGRIKPDVAAVGTDVYSTIESQNYAQFTGTSMACPGTAGTLATLYQAFRHHQTGADPDGGLMKAILMNTTDDLGNAGPDFKHGFGRINARQAYEVISNGQFITDSISQGGTKTFQLQVPSGLAELRVMVYWTDPSGSPVAAQALVNNLDFTLVKNGSGTSPWTPWVLDPSPNATSLNSPAVQGIDSLNNVEQITVSSPLTGDYTITVNGTAIPSGPQKFYIVYTFIEEDLVLTYPLGGESFVPGQQEVIRWEAEGITGTATVEYSTDGGTTWTSLASGIALSQGYYSWTVANVPTHQARVRITSGTYTVSSPGNFVIAAVPANLSITWACPDSVRLNWQTVPGATAYEVSVLGAMYMDSVDQTTQNFYILRNINPNTSLWWSVRAIMGTNSKGRRAEAQFKAPGTFNCLLNQDVELAQVLRPVPSLLPSCQDLSTYGVEVLITNNGISPISNFPISYRIDGGTVQSATYSGTLSSGQQDVYTFATPMGALATGMHNLELWTDPTGDGNPYNDTIRADFEIYSSSLVTLPYSQDFESFNPCGTGSDCEQTVCSLAGGWVNPDNGVWDGIDWRTDAGGTPSSGTGPGFDHNPGSSLGNYLYLEASGPCVFQTAYLYSPCIDLTSASQPEMSFWYHALGANIGELHVDLLVDGKWETDVVPPVIGSQGNSWNQIIVNLVPYTGKTILMRLSGSTTDDYAGDLAVDDFSVYEVTTAPSPAFGYSSTETCIGAPVVFDDQSIGAPTSWNWTISPGTYNLLNGTTLSSQNMEVAFTALGSYDVKLVVSNGNGSDSITYTALVDVVPGQGLPLYEEFNTLPTNTGWTIENPDGGTTWSLTNGFVTGIGGTGTRAVWINNYNYNAVGEEDGLTSVKVEVPAGSDARLLFDVAYAHYGSGYDDGLRVDVSDDCGYSYVPTGYFKQGAALATLSFGSSFTPSSAAQWRTDTVDLSAWAGYTLTLRFVGINAYGNNLYLDNVRLLDLNQTAPTAQISASTDTVCQNASMTFSDLGSGATGQLWNFGLGASPGTASGPGPHAVSYSSYGNKTVALTSSSPGGIAQDSRTLEVTPLPDANFSVSASGMDVTLTDLSTLGANAWEWDFGDGNTSNLQNPQHTYAAPGTYLITLTALNDCGQDQLSRSVTVNWIGLEEETGGWNIYPNPAVSVVNIERSGQLGFGEVELMNITGGLVQAVHMDAGQESLNLDVSRLPAGVYLLRIRTNGELITHRITIR